MKDGCWNKVKFFISNNSDASFDEIYQMLRKPFARRQAAMFIAMS
jgi:hypothetical protein